MLTIKDVIAKFPPQVRERYDFTNARYTGALEPITGIVCAEHGKFKQYAAQLRKDGAGCPACGDKVRRDKQRLSVEEVVAQARKIHGDKYSYDKMVYKNSASNITITCPEHGDFEQHAGNHLYQGQGCPTCGEASRGKRITDLETINRNYREVVMKRRRPEFFKRAKEIHGDAYDYSQVDYQGMKERVTIICPKHGPFSQTPGHHLSRSHGCPECSHHKSKGESAIGKFVGAFTEVVTRDRALIAPKELDIYLPEHNLAIEYCGEYWHAARSIEDEQRSKNRHFDKLKACEAKGIRLLTIYESEWLESPQTIKRLIRNAMGKSKGKLMARKCVLAPVSNYDAARFYDKYHPQGGGGHGQHYGLYHNGKVVACMRFTFGANDRGAYAEQMWTLSRYATRVTVQGGASRLFKAFLDEHPGCDVKSFSDNRYFTGKMYEQLGFKLEETSPPDYQVWHPQLGLMPKTSWQRRKIPTRIREIGSSERFDPLHDARSERDMTYLLGARRIFDCGKKRWVFAHSQSGSASAILNQS